MQNKQYPVKQNNVGLIQICSKFNNKFQHNNNVLTIDHLPDEPMELGEIVDYSSEEGLNGKFQRGQEQEQINIQC